MVASRMKTINLTKGYVAVVDDDEYELLSKYKWNACVKPNRVYAQRRAWTKVSTHIVYMHRQLLNFPSSHVDHINGNCLDNRKSNLRIVTRSQNGQNCGPKRGKNGKYKGTEKTRNKWSARIRVQGKRYYLGSFKTEREAAEAYDRAAIHHYGEFAYQNFNSRGRA
jgi:hypothetical protein